MHIAQYHYGYNRFRAMFPRESRQVMDVIHGVPDGHRIAGQTGPDMHALAYARTLALAGQGVPVDVEVMVWGSDPITAIKERFNQGMYLGYGVVVDAKGDPVYASWPISPDLTVTGPKPFSKWGYRPDPNIDSDAGNMELDAVGWLYPYLPLDTWDVGSVFTEASKQYIKVAWEGKQGAVNIAWQRTI